MSAEFWDSDLAVKIRHPEWFVDRAVGKFLSPEDAVVITGFWRSGTTWLQQSIARSLNAKTVLEPLYSEFDPYGSILSQVYEPDLSRSFRIPFMPYCGERFENRDLLKEYVHQSLVSSLPGIHVRKLRYNAERTREVVRGAYSKLNYRLRDSMKTRVVVKFTRAHLLLPAISSCFNPIVLHIRRDPRAVLSSIRQTEWSWQEEIQLKDQLFEINDGRQDIFRTYSEAIYDVESMSSAAKIAAYWICLENYVQDVAEENSRLVMLNYERLCTEGNSYLASQLRNSGVNGPVSSIQLLERDSATTQSERKGTSVQERIHGWCNELSVSDREEVEFVLNRFDATPRIAAS